MQQAGIPSRIEVVEVGPGDGLRHERTAIAAPDRVELVERAVAAGLRRIEVAAFGADSGEPERLLAALPRPDGVRYLALVLDEPGLDRAAAAGVDEVNAIVAATDGHAARTRCSSTEQDLARWAELAARAHRHGLRPIATIAVAFGCPLEGEVSAEHVAALARRIADAGPAEIVLADTAGTGVPTQVVRVLERVREEAPGVPVRCHFHNTRNTGYANAATAFLEGVAALDASIGGIGGSAEVPGFGGTVATEDLTYLLTGMGVHTGLDADALAAAGTWLGERLHRDVPAMLGRTS
ncbi:hydroxymethylglutaryl-CoA lyase [Saccharopolyspora sp. NPDC047091]|uniref:hydroxymethylglutaryl-CoA lyase n=1 Tax=Saccharopolyspora sp. NPDC047091 TaxID=3155924 RepID=UPI0033EB3BCC